MKRTFTTIILSSLFLLSLQAQTSISGIINNYAKVTIVDNSDNCNPFLSVDDASVFEDGDTIMIIQMQGASIDNSNTSSFGAVTNLNSAGLNERAIIDYISGNDIYLLTEIVNTYDTDGSVQIVDIPQYGTVSIDNPLTAMPWNGDKGGIIALEASGVVALNSVISTKGMGFRGGITDNQPTTCNFSSDHQDYSYPDSSSLGDSKGEGIANFIIGMENGRGAQANGGGGGNDHNSGGGGGSSFGTGGQGGLNLNPTPGQCLGQYPGIGGYSVGGIGNRIFMGGGGGSGHTNDGTGSNGGNGGGIIYIKANLIEGNWRAINAEGDGFPTTTAFDGGGGGGGGGTVILDINIFSQFSGLSVSTHGANGSNSNAIGANQCMGPGGGGGGGIIYTNLSHANLLLASIGGIAGVVENSSNSCNGTSIGANDGAPGAVLPTPSISEGNLIDQIAFTADPTDISICEGDMASFSVSTDNPANAFQWQIDDGTGYGNTVDGSNYSGSNASMLDVSSLSPGTYTIQCVVNGGCNDIITSEAATLEILEAAQITVNPLDQTICENDEFILMADASGNNVDYLWQVNDGTGFTNVIDNASYSGSSTNNLTIQADAGIAGYQYLCIANNDCPGSSTSNIATITIDPLPVPDFTFDIINDTVYVTNMSTGGDTYYWDFGLGEPLEPGATPYHIYEQSGTYSITVYAVNDCGTTSITYDIAIFGTGIFDTEIVELDINLFPNPTSTYATLDLSGENFQEANIRIFSLDGKMISSDRITQNIHTIDVNGWAKGTYLVQIIIEEKTYTTKLMVR